MRIRYLATLLMLMLFCHGELLAAEKHVVVKEYTYYAGETDSKQRARWSALEQTKRLLLEEIGTYLESVTSVRDAKLTRDEITTITGGVLQTEVISEKWNGEVYWVRAKMTADPDSVGKAIGEIRGNENLVKELQNAKTAADAALGENQRLRKELELMKADQEKTAEYQHKVKDLGDRQAAGARYLKSAKELAARSGRDSEARENRGKAEEYLGRGFVDSELPAFRIYLPGQYVFKLRAGEQNDHWIAGPSNSAVDYRVSSTRGSDYVRIYEDGSIADKRAMVRSNKRFKFRAITDSEIRIVFY